jgi:hypothetical protein
VFCYSKILHLLFKDPPKSDKWHLKNLTLDVKKSNSSNETPNVITVGVEKYSLSAQEPKCPRAQVPKSPRGKCPSGKSPSAQDPRCPRAQVPKSKRGKSPSGKSPSAQVPKCPRAQVPKSPRGQEHKRQDLKCPSSQEPLCSGKCTSCWGTV